jgi:inner membrane protein
MKTQEKTIVETIGQYIRQSVTLKLLSIFILMLLLMIPVSLVMELINERDVLRQSAVNEVSNKWANAQQVLGPVLTLPFNRQVLDGDKVKTVREEAHILPSLLTINGEVEPRSLHRGIYEVVVYDSRVFIEGSFAEFEKHIAELGGMRCCGKRLFLQSAFPICAGLKKK